MAQTLLGPRSEVPCPVATCDSFPSRSFRGQAQHAFHHISVQSTNLARNVFPLFIFLFFFGLFWPFDCSLFSCNCSDCRSCLRLIGSRVSFFGRKIAPPYVRISSLGFRYLILLGGSINSRLVGRSFFS